MLLSQAVRPTGAQNPVALSGIAALFWLSDETRLFAVFAELQEHNASKRRRADLCLCLIPPHSTAVVSSPVPFSHGRIIYIWQGHGIYVRTERACRWRSR